ncbi:MAG: hypothetical protein M1834_006298 [Cirrosporium novae-zelandiae]|nr:MAG: hypothetical protein M1834_006298 [Cirrosporium novae-zelandiae]
MANQQTLQNFLSYFRIPVIASSAIAALGSGLLYFKQNEIIYPRNLPVGSRTEVPRPSQVGVSDYEDLQLRTPDGESLHAYFIRPSNRSQAKNVTILMFHGNAGNIGHRLPIAHILEEHIGCNVLMLEYRGYGLSTGTPFENGLIIDAQTGLDYLRQRPEAKQTKIVIYGQSIGGAVAVALTAKNQQQQDIAGLVLENTFLSIRKLIPRQVGHIPVSFLSMTNGFHEEALPKIKDIPVLFLSGLKDEIIPPSHMKQLYSVCKSRTKIWREFPHGQHNDTVAEPHYFEWLYDFVTEEVLKQAVDDHQRVKDEDQSVESEMKSMNGQPTL